MTHILMVEADGQPTVHLHLEEAPEIKFEVEGLQGPPGPGIVDYDPGDLTVTFDNKLV